MRRLLLLSLAALALGAAPAAGVQPRDDGEAAQLQARYRDAVVRLRRLEEEAAAAARVSAAAPAAVEATPSADRTRLDALPVRPRPVTMLIVALTSAKSVETNS